MLRRRPIVAIVVTLCLLAALGATPPLLWRFATPGSRAQLLAARVSASLGFLEPEDARWVGMAAVLRHENPIRDAREAIAQGDQRLVGVAGIGLFFPGRPTGGLREDWKVEPRTILGAGDGGTSFTFLYQAASYDYALAYNRVILKHIGAAYE
jgi:hypothetical protein